MINFDNVAKENIKERNPNWPQIPSHLYRIIIIGSSGSRKTSSLFSLTNQPPDFDETYLYAKDLNQAKFYAPFYCENSKQTKTSKICIQ